MTAPGPAPLRGLAQAVRLPLIGVTYLFVFAGAFLGPTAPEPSRIAALAAAGALCHVSVYGLNNLLDRDVDATSPARAGQRVLADFLPPAVALAVVVLAGPLGAVPLLTGVHGEAAALSWVVASGLLWWYDAAGKTCRLPPVTDAVQGLGWGLLLLASTLCTGGDTATGGWLVGWSVAFITLVNGGHGALRDVENDARHGRRTTATMAMRSALAAGAPVRLGPRYRVYLHLLNVLRTAALVGACLRTVHGAAAGRALAPLLVLEVGGWVLLERTMRLFPDDRCLRLGMAHICLAMLGPVLVARYASGSDLVWVLAVAPTLLWLTAANARAVVLRRYAG